MILHGFIKFCDDNLTFVQPVFIDEYNSLYVQDSSNKQDTIERFVKLGSIDDVNKDVFVKLDNKIEKNIGESILYIFKTHNGMLLIGSKDELIDSLDDCYRQVFFSLFELMNFLGKKEYVNSIKKCLFFEYMNVGRNNKNKLHIELMSSRSLFKIPKLNEKSKHKIRLEIDELREYLSDISDIAQKSKDRHKQRNIQNKHDRVEKHSKRYESGGV